MDRILAAILLTALVVVIDCKREAKFAPYVYVSNNMNLVDMKQQTGLNAVSLAFALSGAGCSPTWDGAAIDSAGVVNAIKAFKSAGGQVIVSTGGANGNYLENACKSVNDLTNAYKRVVQVTGANGLDIDIEKNIPLDTVMQALANVQKSTPGLTISFTLGLQGDDYGIVDGLGVNVLKSAVQHGIDVDLVNPMTMDYQPGGGRSVGDSVIRAGESVVKQMKKVWPQKSDQELYGMLGITPMIGQNDNGIVFTLDHARQLLKWAQQKNIGHIGFWDIQRDKACKDNSHVGASPTCSGIAQQPYDFSKIFAAFK